MLVVECELRENQQLMIYPKFDICRQEDAVHINQRVYHVLCWRRYSEHQQQQQQEAHLRFMSKHEECLHILSVIPVYMGVDFVPFKKIYLYNIVANHWCMSDVKKNLLFFYDFLKYLYPPNVCLAYT